MGRGVKIPWVGGFDIPLPGSKYHMTPVIKVILEQFFGKLRISFFFLSQNI
jgi:hypothetical protein